MVQAYLQLLVDEETKETRDSDPQENLQSKQTAIRKYSITNIPEISRQYPNFNFRSTSIMTTY